jgi:ketosteroid isomerase-like protein
MSLTQAEMRAIVDGLYAATGVGDFDKAEEFLTDDFFITEAAGLPMAGLYKGKTALRNLFTQVMGMMDVAGLDRTFTATAEDEAVCHVTFQFTDPSLKPAELLELFRFKGGKVSEIRPYYFDPATVVAACAAKARPK